MTRLFATCVLTAVALGTLDTATADHHEKKDQKVLRHVVLFQFKKDADPTVVKKVEEEFAKLPKKIDSIKDFEWGKNNSPEGLNDGLTHCFLVTFENEAGRAKYLPHPAHKEFVELLMPVLEKATVVDYWSK